MQRSPVESESSARVAVQLGRLPTLVVGVEAEVGLGGEALQQDETGGGAAFECGCGETHGVSFGYAGTTLRLGKPSAELRHRLSRHQLILREADVRRVVFGTH